MSRKGQFSSDEKLSKFSYWKSLYQKKSQDIGFDWFLDAKGVLGTVLDHIQQVTSSSTQGHGSKSVSYLDLGCGTSDLPLNVLQHCPHSLGLILLDFVPEALTYQLDKLTQCKSMMKDTTSLGVVADVQKLPFECDTFNIIVDKGTMDALLKDKCQGHHKTQLMMSEILRVLAPGGRYLQVSDEDPDSRMLFLEQTCEQCHTTATQAYSVPSTCPHPTPLQLASIECMEKAFKQFILPTGRLLNRTDLLQYSQCILHYSDNQEHNRNVFLENHVKDNCVTHHKLSPWSFQVLSSSSATEYFLYWADKL